MIKNATTRLKQLYWTIRSNLRSPAFPGSSAYWENRYVAGGNSGVGSYGKFATFKAEVLNEFVRVHRVGSVIEHGCGDGHQLELAEYPKYLGFDVSEAAVRTCQTRFASDPTKTFRVTKEYVGSDRADLTLSLDVIYHLVEDTIYLEYMERLFDSSDRYVIVYSSNTTDNRGFKGTHVRHRRFTDWVDLNRPQWQLTEHIPNRYPYEGDYREGSFADFFVFSAQPLDQTAGARSGVSR